MACLVAIRGEARFLTEALQWAQEAHRLLPGARTVQGTSGSLLVLAARFEEGLKLLRPLTLPDGEPIDRSISACYIANAEHRLGNAEAADAALRLGLSLDASLGVCERIQNEIASERTATKRTGS